MQRLGKYSVGAARGDDRLWRVFDGTDEAGRPVSIKIIHANLIASDKSRSAVIAGMRALVGVSHPHVLRHLDVVEEGRECALVVAPAEGETLRERLARVHRLSWPEALAFAIQIAGGLAAAHAANPVVVHGDLKPEHILLSAEGVKLVDFDFTWTVKDAQGESTAGFRNLRYMSPEAIDAAGVEPRSDLYCLGLVLYEMLTGAPPFSAMAPLDLLNAQCTKPPPPLSDALRAELPSGLEPLIKWLLQKRKEDRPASAVEVVRLLEGIRHGQPDPAIFGSSSQVRVAVSTAGVDSAPQRPASSPLPIVLGVGIVALLGLAGAGFFVFRGDGDAPVATRNVDPPPSSSAGGGQEPDEPPEPQPDPEPDPDGGKVEPDPIDPTNFGINPEALPPDDPGDPAAAAVGDEPPIQEQAVVQAQAEATPPAQEDGGSPLSGVVEQLSQASEAQAKVPTRSEKIASWVNGRLTGHDNRVASFRTVDIDKKGSGHTIFIKNQFLWTCDLDFDETGSPSKLRNCKSGDPPWNTKTNPIKLKCTTDETKEICRGKYGLSSGTGFGSTETMQIVRRLPKPKE